MNNTRDILAHAGDAACAINHKKRVVYWNPAAEKLLGISAEEAAGQPCWKLLQGKTLAGKPFCGAQCPIDAKIDSDEPIPHFDLQIVNKNGDTILTNFSTFAIPKHNGSRKPDEAAIVHLMRRIKTPEMPQYRLRINVLGPLEVWRADGSQVSGKFWRRAKVRGLLVLLAFNKGEPISRDDLTKILWPQLEYKAALRNLNTTVYNLRRSLEPELEQGNESNYIFYESGFYWLGGNQPHQLDVDAFYLGIKQARLETAVSQAAHLYEKALALYRGDYLIDLITTNGIASIEEQMRLRTLYLSAMEELGGLYTQQEQIEMARKTYLKILSIDPTRESTCHLLAQLSHKAGSRPDSIAYCQRLASALKSELDLILNQEREDQHYKKS